MPRGATPKPVLERFIARVDFDAPNGCWLWTAGTTTDGYGALRVNGVMVRVHRLVWELFVGPIPDGLTIDHLCRVRRCVYPDHLEPVPNRVNWDRGISPTAINAQKTRCIRGHPFDEDNTAYWKDGRRRCRTCLRESGRAKMRRWRARQQEVR